jgi:hypothetical protein
MSTSVDSISPRRFDMARSPSALVALAAAFTAAAAPGAASAQYAVFQSHQSANLATTETLRGGNWLFEISHRFQTPIESGTRELWGVDGPAWIRLGLSWAPTDRVLFGILRTNNEDNVELNARGRLLETELGSVPVHVAAVGGVAWNTDPLPFGADDNEMQAYVQVVANTILAERVALGVAPTWLHNPLIHDPEAESTASVGVYGQWYLGDAFSVLGEWIVSEELPGLEHDTGTIGVEIRTRGHHFKLVATNQPALNPTQNLAGSPNAFAFDQLRFGFNITRLLPF